VVVVSAMGDTTDELISLSQKITKNPGAREMDMLLTAGERISVALFSMALERLNLRALSFTGSQVGIITDNRHTDARILEIKGERIKKALAEGKIPVVCGFQGVSMEKEITTLGRGGSDTTAVALSAALGAKKCIIYTDVDGVYTEDPNRFSGARKIKRLSYEEMLELASRGAKVLHPRASGIAARYNIPVEIKSSFKKNSGTLITSYEGIERPKPKAITHSENLYLVTLIQVPRNPHYLSQLTTELTNGGIHLKFFFHGISDAKNFDLSFITPLSERKKVLSIIKKIAKRLRIKEFKESLDICSVSIVGAGIGSDNRILSEIFNTLSKIKTHIEAVTTSELSINLFLKQKFLDKTVNSLLRKFNLIR
ncbi:MAG: aspartate kinase, partial [candidate division WOR-3 bacterium]